MSKTRGRAIRKKAISELERLSLTLDEGFEVTANLTIAEIDDELREMGIDPAQLPSLSLDQVLSNSVKPPNPAYAYISDELLRHEQTTDEVKLLMLKVRHLGRQQRYKEALDLAEQATLLAPTYWRAWVSYAGAHVLLGNLDEGEAIFQRMLTEYTDNPKAVAAALHGRANIKEIRCRLNPTAVDLVELTQLYGDALELDDSRSNTRACLIINTVLAGQVIESKKLFEDSLQYEGFFDAMSLELNERDARKYGAKMYRVLQTLPMWFRNLLYGSQSVNGGMSESTALA